MPYGLVTIFAGIVVVRSLLFGSAFGLITGRIAKNIYDKNISWKIIKSLEGNLLQSKRVKIKKRKK